MSNSVELLKEIYKYMLYTEIYYVLLIGFFTTLIVVKYLKVFIYKYLPTNYKAYYLLSCVQCTGFWVTMLLLVGAYVVFGFLFENNLFLYVLSIISVAYALFTSPLFKISRSNHWFSRQIDFFLKACVLEIYMILAGLVGFLNYKFIFNFLIVPLAFSVVYVLLLNIFKLLRGEK